VFRSETEQAEQADTSVGVPLTPAVAAAQKPLPAGGPLRFAWLPFAFVCSTVLELFPSHDHRSGRS
jgi:hypothetical protein